MIQKIHNLVNRIRTFGFINALQFYLGNFLWGGGDNFNTLKLLKVLICDLFVKK